MLDVSVTVFPGHTNVVLPLAVIVGLVHVFTITVTAGEVPLQPFAFVTKTL